MDPQKLCCCWEELVQGRACLLYRIIFCPIILPYHAIRIFCGGLCWIYCGWWSTCSFLKGRCWDDFNDEEFPPELSSIGRLQGDTASGILAHSGTAWMRVSEMLEDEGGAMLYEGQIEFADLQQGAIGDCWLIAAMACVAARPEILQMAIISKTVDARGKYYFRLWDQVRDKPGTQWLDIEIDDFIPVYPGTKDPKFAKHHNNEAWAMLMEKAFAKMYGGYNRLEGGSMWWALTAITGNPAVALDKNNGRTWRAAEGKEGRQGMFYSDQEFDDDEFFKFLMRLNREGAFICCAGIAKPPQYRQGLIEGHAYSVLKLCTVQKDQFALGEVFRLVCIRNPHGGGEWQGAWSDKSPLWQQYPHVRRRLWIDDGVEDGTFWMDWQDFVSYWKGVQIVDCETNIQTVSIPVFDETHGGVGCHLGPFAACIKGCCDYWLCCTGMKRLYFGRPGAKNVDEMKEDMDAKCGYDQTGCFCYLCDKKHADYDELSGSESSS
eukprot:TRINITY_DN65717_c0_g1_i1.p1 TRINITY_DN65717_c0_g1~~TRINITY_DN65717_c0_g1_i1.p1  ORF type:complete len:491 (-),score=96.95 TRINITY_DN65717_c0_g1_i1:122-1594(-)